MNRTMWLRERRMEKFCDVLGRVEAKRLSALDAAELLGMSERTVGRDNTVRYGKRILQLPAGPHRPYYVKAQVRVHEYPDGTLAVFHGPRCLARYHTTDGEPFETPTRKAA